MAKKKNGYFKENGKWVYYANGKVLEGKDIIRHRTTGQTEKNILQGGFIDPLSKNLSNAAKDVLLIGRGSDKTSGGKPISALQEKYADQRGIKIDPRTDPRLQQQYLNNDERVPQSGIATDFLDGLSAKVDFSNANKLSIAPSFRPENIQKFADAGYQVPGKFTGLKANVNDEASNENAVVTENTEDNVVPIKDKGTTYDNPLDDPDYNPEATNANKNKAKLAMGGQSMRTMEERTKAIERAYGSMSKEAKRKLRLRPITQLELEAM